MFFIRVTLFVVVVCAVKSVVNLIMSVVLGSVDRFWLTSSVCRFALVELRNVLLMRSSVFSGIDELVINKALDVSSTTELAVGSYISLDDDVCAVLKVAVVSVSGSTVFVAFSNDSVGILSELLSTLPVLVRFSNAVVKISVAFVTSRVLVVVEVISVNKWAKNGLAFMISIGFVAIVKSLHSVTEVTTPSMHLGFPFGSTKNTDSPTFSKQTHSQQRVEKELMNASKRNENTKDF